jgi:hypothetical protein
MRRIFLELRLPSLEDTYEFLELLRAIVHWLPYCVDSNGNSTAAESMTHMLCRLRGKQNSRIYSVLH